MQLQRAMAAEAEAAREARAKVIAAEGEQKASRALREAAEVISESPSALQVCRHIIDTWPSFRPPTRRAKKLIKPSDSLIVFIDIHPFYSILRFISSLGIALAYHFQNTVRAPKIEYGLYFILTMGHFWQPQGLH